MSVVRHRLVLTKSIFSLWKSPHLHPPLAQPPEVVTEDASAETVPPLMNRRPVAHSNEVIADGTHAEEEGNVTLAGVERCR